MTLFGLPDRADQAIYQCQLVAISNEISDLIHLLPLKRNRAVLKEETTVIQMKPRDSPDLQAVERKI